MTSELDFAHLGQRRRIRQGMRDPFFYTSPLNHGQLTEKAIRDVYDISTYIDVGTADEPLPYPVKMKDRDSYFGKQMMTMTPKWGFQTNDVFFQKEHPWVSDGDLYIDRSMYVESQPDRYKGFWTSDFSKYDEFSVTCRTEQHREQLRRGRVFRDTEDLVRRIIYTWFVDRDARMYYLEAGVETNDLLTSKTSHRLLIRVHVAFQMENRHLKRATEQSEARIAAIKAKYPDIDKPHRTRFDGPKYLYDVGRAGLATTKHCTRCHKQTYYCPHNAAYSTNNPGLEKDMGGLWTLNLDYGAAAKLASYEKPKYAKKPVVRDQMYRRTKIFFQSKTPLGFPA